MTTKKFSQIIKKNRYTFLLLSILFLAGFFRTIGFNWDQNQHLHPDERFLTMVVSSIKMPPSLSDYFNSKTSSLNPYNNNFDFYVYGTFPLLITRFFGEILNLTSYEQIFLIGRVLAIVFDVSTILLIFFISLKIFKKNNIAIFGAFFYSICILPIQQSHFFTVDSFTVFFFTLTILLTISNRFLLSGLIFGLTLANKTSVGITLPIFLFFIFIANKNFPKSRKTLIKYLIDGIFKCCLFLIFVFISFRIFQPYAFDGFIKFSSNFLSNIKEAHQMITGEIDYPPNIQWENTLPIIHPLFNLFFFGVGPITFLLFIFGIIQILKTRRLIKQPKIIILLTIFLTIFLYHSILLAKYMRYFYPIYPIITIFAGYGFSCLNRKTFFPIFLINIFTTVSFINIYLHPHSRYSSSEWICKNIPNISNISHEVWDDSLPLNSISCTNKTYIYNDLTLFDSDSSQKWTRINEQLKSVDYLVLSSNRLWGSIPNDTKRYPLTSDFYKNLFDGNTDFKLVKRIYSYPGFSLPFLKKCVLIGLSVYPYNTSKNNFFEVDNSCNSPGIYFRDDIAEESFTVYDHPQVNIFAKVD